MQTHPTINNTMGLWRGRGGGGGGVGLYTGRRHRLLVSQCWGELVQNSQRFSRRNSPSRELTPKTSPSRLPLWSNEIVANCQTCLSTSLSRAKPATQKNLQTCAKLAQELRSKTLKEPLCHNPIRSEWEFSAKYISTACSNCKRQLTQLMEYHKEEIDVGGVHDMLSRSILINGKATEHEDYV